MSMPGYPWDTTAAMCAALAAEQSGAQNWYPPIPAPLPPASPTSVEITKAAQAQLAALKFPHPIITKILQDLLANPTTSSLARAIVRLQGHTAHLNPLAKKVAARVASNLSVMHNKMGGHIHTGAVPTTSQDPTLAQAFALVASAGGNHPIISNILTKLEGAWPVPPPGLVQHAISLLESPSSVSGAPQDTTLALQVAQILKGMLSFGQSWGGQGHAHPINLPGGTFDGGQHAWGGLSGGNQQLSGQIDMGYHAWGGLALDQELTDPINAHGARG